MDQIQGHNIQSLNGNDWKVAGWWPNQWRFMKTASMTDVLDIPVPGIKASVPGAVQVDLIQAGMIPEVDIDRNSLLSEWTENREWAYEKKFRISRGFKGKRLMLVFLGLDYHGQVILNGQKLAEFEGMFIPLQVEITEKVVWDKENVLNVVFYQTPEEYGQFGWSENVKHFKSRFNYIWDWCARAVPVGIWDSVYIKAMDKAHLQEISLQTELLGGFDGLVSLNGIIQSDKSMDASLRATVLEKGKTIASKIFQIRLKKGDTRFKNSFNTGKISAWFPNGYGQQKLYDLSIELVKGRQVLDAMKKRIGFKKIELERNEDSPQKAPGYTLKINNRKIFLQGVNWMVPIPYYGSADESLYRSELLQFKTMGCNIIRVWGGAILEKEIFYDLCDSMGLMVFQEFPQSSSGISNLPVKSKAAIMKLEQIAEIYIRRRGWHASHVMWDCGNELMNAKGKPVDESYPCIEALASLCRRLDPGKWFLPTSASGPTGYAHEQNYGKGSHYEVHGPWLYLGEKTHYGYFNKDDSLARFEIGSPGAADLSSLEYITKKEKIWPPLKENPQWVHHGSWWIIPEMMELIFGKWRKDKNEIGSFVKCSQYLQFESLRYSTESCLRRAFKCSAIMYWAGNEPFLNTANNSIIDAFGHTKMAYAGIQKAFSSFHISLKYNQLGYVPGEKFSGTVFLHCKQDLPGRIEIKIALRDINGMTFLKKKYERRLKRLFSQEIGDIEYSIKKIQSGMFFVEIRAEYNNKPLCRNVYAFSIGKKNPLEFLRFLPKTQLSYRLKKGLLYITNTGRHTAVGTRLFNTDHRWALIHRNNYEIIFPGESVTVEFSACERKDPSRPGLKGGPVPDLRLDAISMDEIKIKNK